MAGFVASKATEQCIQATATHRLLGANWGCDGMGSHGKRAPSPLAAASGSSQVLPGAVVPDAEVWNGADLLALKRFVSWGLPPGRGEAVGRMLFSWTWSVSVAFLGLLFRGCHHNQDGPWGFYLPHKYVTAHGSLDEQ